MLTSGRPFVLMEAHDGLSAKLAEEAGFEALWASGLAISASLGVRDSNELAWTQVLEVLEFMTDATRLPVLLDGDTGYGNFNNVRRLVRKLEMRRVAGVCLEDKLFPKTNSFLGTGRQQLAEVDEFCGKIRAAKDTQRDADFVVVARTEAFIAGCGVDEALIRASAYAESGADAVLVHSKRATPEDIHAFLAGWDRTTPVVVVPTMYPQVPIRDLAERGVRGFIFANQSVRTVITALQRNLARLRESWDLMSIEAEIAPVREIFRLQDVAELEASEHTYLPSGRPAVTAVVLAASRGDLGSLVEHRPKCMVWVHDRPLLAWQVSAFHRQDVRRICVVRGYASEAVDLPDLEYVDNVDHATTGELASLYAARRALVGDVVVAYGDILFDDFILRNLLSETARVGIAADAGWRRRRRDDDRRDLVSTTGASTPLGGPSRLTAIGPDLPHDDVTGEFIGLLCLRGEGTRVAAAELERLAVEAPDALRAGDLALLLRRLVLRGVPVEVLHTFGHWHDVDQVADLAGLQG